MHITRKILFSITMLLLLPTCGQADYEKDFFSISEISPKSDITMCSDQMKRLFAGATDHLDFLINQTKNIQEIGYVSYPITYTRSDIANKILTYIYGEISVYYPDYNFQKRIEANGDADKMASYANYLFSLWSSAKDNGKLTPIQGVCD